MKTIVTEDLLKIINENSDHSQYVLVDVRNPDEWAGGVLPGVKTVSLTVLPLHMNEFSPEKEYIFICRSGNRSGQACLLFEQHGLKNVTNYVGGMLDWYEKKLPITMYTK